MEFVCTDSGMIRLNNKSCVSCSPLFPLVLSSFILIHLLFAIPPQAFFVRKKHTMNNVFLNSSMSKFKLLCIHMSESLFRYWMESCFTCLRKPCEYSISFWNLVLGMRNLTSGWLSFQCGWTGGCGGSPPYLKAFECSFLYY